MTLKECKASLKAQAANIRSLKSDLRKAWQEKRSMAPHYQSEIYYAKRNYRYQHVAYCLVRGKTLEMVEPFSRTPLDMRVVDKIMQQIEFPKQLACEAEA